MPKLIMLKGLPASGKSTWAKEFVLSQSNSSWKRVNKDDLRAMLDAGKWSKQKEEKILLIRDFIIAEQLTSGGNIIVDDTNFHPKHEARLRQIAYIHKSDFEIKEFTTDVNECIERDAKRANGVGKDVIWRMWKESIIPKVAWPEDRLFKTPVVICDLDGTIAEISHRSPYDTEKCEQDSLHEDVMELVNQSTETRYLVLVSGRSDKYREETERWLNKNEVVYEKLFMRKEGDTRKDWLVKFEILRDEIMPNYNPIAVFDDRDQVVAMWRAQGLRCYQVADGNF